LTVPASHADRAEGRRSLRRALVATIGTLTVAAAAIAFDPDQSRVIVQLAVTLIGIIVVAGAVGALRRAAPLAPRSLLDATTTVARRPVGASPLPIDLVRISRRLAAAEASAADARRHLGPLVATIAADRLRRGAHVEVDRDSVYSHLPRPVPAALALVLDPALADVDTWELPGLDTDAADALVRALEQLEGPTP
jgi:hypothetical protein